MKYTNLFSKLVRRELRLSVKLSIVLCILWILPIALMLAISLRHLRTIQNVAVEGARNILFTSQTQLLEGRLNQQANHLSTLFTRLQDETFSLASFSQTMFASPSRLSYRNGSRYYFEAGKNYYSPVDDGNSALYVFKYRRSLDKVIVATEALDLMLKPLVEHEPRIVLGWIIHRDGVARALPWRDFRQMPPDKVQTSWPFYYLADAKHDPDKRVIFTPVYLDPLSHVWMISCLSPVYAGERYVATVGLDITIHKLLKEISDVSFSKGTSVMLVSGTEIVAASDNLPLATLGLNPASPPHGQNLVHSVLPGVRHLADRLNAEKESIQFFDVPGLRAYVGHSTVDLMGWKMVLIVPENEFIGLVHENGKKILSELKGIILNYAHILIFTLIGVAAATFLLFIHQSKGLRILLSGIHMLGDGDLSHRMPEDETEFGQLAKALNSMAQSLLERKAELLRITAEVEQGRKLTAVGRLAAGVAHEVNNPLATISTYTQLLLRRTDLPDEVPGNLRKVMAEIQRIQSQLRNLLDLSRLQSPVITELAPNIVIKEVADLVGHEAAARGMELCLTMGTDCQNIRVDRSGLKQIAWNLLSNALDAQESGGSIKVRTFDCREEGKPPSFVFEVEDDGPGIPEQVMPHIFEPFFTSKEFGKGTGLGLAVVYGIVKGHGGVIEVHNISPRGCLFRVAFPR